MTLSAAQKDFSKILLDIQDCYQTMYSSDKSDYVIEFHNIKTSLTSAREVFNRYTKKLSRGSEIEEKDKILLMTVRNNIKSLQDRLRDRYLEIIEEYISL
jgi:hypothetical protein